MVIIKLVNLAWLQLRHISLSHTVLIRANWPISESSPLSVTEIGLTQKCMCLQECWQKYYVWREKNYLAHVQSFTRPTEFDSLPHSVLVNSVAFPYSYSTDEDRKGKHFVQGHMARKRLSQAEVWRPRSPVFFSFYHRLLLYVICFYSVCFFAYFVVFKDPWSRFFPFLWSAM